MSPKSTTYFICRECGEGSASWLGKCPSCGSWNSFEESKKDISGTVKKSGRKSITPKIKTFSDLTSQEVQRHKSGIAEFDRVLGGGIVPGSLVLLGGEPGVGKSTILLQLSEGIGLNGLKVLYVSGEESDAQIKMRGGRLGISSENVYFLTETSFEEILEQLEISKPNVLIIDSLQTIKSERSSAGGAGSISQVRDITTCLLEIAKQKNCTIFLTGHVTKEGMIAGPRTVEHIVDTVLYFEGEKNYQHRIIKTTKNRFGPAGEVGIFEMRNNGLHPVENPSDLFVDSAALSNPGSVIFPSKDGTRSFLVEIQALVSPSAYGTPRRTVVGVDYNRTTLVIAVIEKRLGIEIGSRDLFINIVGGISVSEPSVDLPLAAAIISSFHEKPVKKGTAIFGEIGLTGEVRGVSGLNARIKEASSQGFDRLITPANSRGKIDSSVKNDIIEINNLVELSEYLF